MKKKDQMYYLKLCKKTLEEIQVTPRDQGKRFLYLKNKAKKYLEMAKKM